MAKYGFLVKVSIPDSERYGSGHKTVYAAEDIKKGQLVFQCDPDQCDYNKDFNNVPGGRTKEEMLDFCAKYPQYVDYVHRYHSMADDDTFYFRPNYENFKITCEGAYINHGCDPCLVLELGDYPGVLLRLVAKRDIKCGEELSYDYQNLGTVEYVNHGVKCQCKSSKCRGILDCDIYRDPKWIAENYNCCSAYIKRKIDELKTKWYSKNCVVKRYNNKTEFGLAALNKIKKDELVAKYCDPKKITRESHYLRHNENANCYVNETGEVYAKHDIEPRTELTLNFKN